jgi:hypothetical protein
LDIDWILTYLLWLWLWLCLCLLAGDVAFSVLLQISCTEHDALLRQLQHQIVKLSTPGTSSSNDGVLRSDNVTNGRISGGSQLRMFLPFLKSLLEDIKNFTESQQRSLFRFDFDIL